MSNTKRKRKRDSGRKEAALLILAITAFVAALAWKVPAKDREREAEQMLIQVAATTEIPQTPTAKAAEMTLTAEPQKSADPPEAEDPPKATEPPEPKKTYLGKFTATAYCSCEICCGEWAKNRPNGIVYTASGAVAEQGVTVGAAWDVLPAGTRIEIEGLGERIVQDRPADWIVDRYDGKIIDVYFESHQAAQDYAKQTVDVWIIEGAEGGKAE